MAKKYTYFKFISFVDKNNVTHSLQTQLYQIGIYGIWNNNPSLQTAYSPKELSKICKNIKKEELAGNLTDAKLIDEITVQEINGLWKEVV